MGGERGWALISLAFGHGDLETTSSRIHREHLSQRFLAFFPNFLTVFDRGMFVGSNQLWEISFLPPFPSLFVSKNFFSPPFFTLFSFFSAFSSISPPSFFSFSLSWNVVSRIFTRSWISRYVTILVSLGNFSL